MNKAFSFKVGDSRSGFVCKNQFRINSLQAEYYEFIHQKTGACYVHLENADENNVFAAGFKTPPKDSTGVAHILEHIVLAGSQKYPVKDPFFSMISRSLKTFMNAFTSSDWTMYPYATQNQKDFYNLMGIYLDAVFFPNLTQSSFYQEGIRLELEEKDDKEELVFKGVVFNEMKGAMSTQQSLMVDALARSLYPATTYGKNSGGDPTDIPNLTLKGLQEFHKDHYHPSNARFYTYGCFSPEKHLDFIEENALKHFDKSNCYIKIGDESRYDTPCEFEYTYPKDQDDRDEDDCQIAFAWLTCKITDTIENLSLSVLENILLGNSASPLRKILLESKLGKSLSDAVGYDDSMREPAFSVGLQGVNPKNFKKVESLILDSLQKLADEGLEQKLVDSAVHQFEFSMKEITGDNPYGLNLLLKNFGSWMHGGNLSQELDFDFLINALKKKISKKNYFESLIRKYFIDNPHRVRVILRGDVKHNERIENRLKEKLRKIERSLTEKQKQKIRKDTANLKKLQSEKEDLSVLPKLHSEDIPKTSEEYPADRIGNHGEKFYGQPTNGIFYTLFRSRLRDIAPESRFELPIILSLLTKVGTKKLSYDQLSLKISNQTGGISFGTSYFAHQDNGAIYEYLTLSGKSLNEKTEFLFSLFAELIEDWSFHDIPRIQTLIGLNANSEKNGIIPSGHIFASSLAKRKFKKTLGISEMYKGISQIRFMQELVGLKTEQLEEKLTDWKKTIRFLLNAPYQDCCLIGDSQSLTRAEKFTEKISGLFPAQALGITDGEKDIEFKDSALREIWTMSSSVSYVARVFLVPDYNSSDSPALLVLSMLLESKFLHREVREKGGAYGGMCAYEMESGAFSLISYRDPNLFKTWDTFSAAISWIQSENFTDEDLEEALLKTFSRIDRPLSPAGKAFSDFAKKSKGLTEEKLLIYREKLLRLKKSDLKKVGAKYLNSEYSDVAITGKDLFEKDDLKSKYSNYCLRSIF